MSGARGPEPGAALPRATTPAELDALVLCGGLGTRLRAAVPDRPKALAEVAGRPFLEILLEALAAQGVRRFVLCTGHGAEAIASRAPAWRRFGEIQLSPEPAPLGTAGAIAHALPHARRDPLLVLNGDSLCAFDLAGMLARHREHGGPLTMAVVRAPERSDAGDVSVDDAGRVLGFVEKSGAARDGLVNAGVYLIESSSLPSPAPGERALSLERECIPELLPSGVYVFPVEGRLMDIGTPDRLAAAGETLREIGCWPTDHNSIFPQRAPADDPQAVGTSPSPVRARCSQI